jgi:hypothetical protein
LGLERRGRSTLGEGRNKFYLKVVDVWGGADGRGGDQVMRGNGKRHVALIGILKGSKQLAKDGKCDRSFGPGQKREG